MRYRIDAGKLTVTAHSRIHDTRTVWDKITGDVEADPETLASAGAVAKFHVDMTAFDAGDWLKNRKLRKDFDMEAHPRALFELLSLRDVARTGSTFTAVAEGILAWRGYSVPLTLQGKGTLDGERVEASASFELDIRKVGLQAPKVLVIKMDDVVAVEVTVRGTVLA